MTDPMTGLHDQIGTLGVALARWSERDDTIPQPEIRQAGNTAVNAVDELTRRLFALRRGEGTAYAAPGTSDKRGPASEFRC